jgi:hypothetical protein
MSDEEKAIAAKSLLRHIKAWRRVWGWESGRMAAREAGAL